MNSVHLVRALPPVSVADNTAQVSQIIDRRGYDSVMFGILTGSLADTDATFVVLLEESDDAGFSVSNAVADADLLGTEVLAGFQFDDDNEPRKLGYLGIKRYLRMTITPSGNASAALLSVLAILGHPHLAPTANRPV
jgi:hypothetical protein